MTPSYLCAGVSACREVKVPDQSLEALKEQEKNALERIKVDGFVFAFFAVL